MRLMLVIMLVSYVSVSAQTQDNRISIQGSFGGLITSKDTPFPMGSFSFSATRVRNNVFTTSLRVTSASLNATPEDDPEYWNYRELSFLFGLRSEAKYANVFVSGGLGVANYQYRAEYPSQSYSPHSVIRPGLAFECGFTLIPVSAAGIGMKIAGHVSTINWYSCAAMLFIDIGNVRKH